MSAPQDQLELKDLTSADISQALELSKEAFWNQIADDWQFMIGKGNAFGFFTPDKRLIASALALPFEGTFGWISMVLVTSEWRRKGLATKLLQRGIQILEANRKTSMLDATEAGRKVYLSMGFNDLYPITRLERNGKKQIQASLDDLPSSVSIREIKESDLAELSVWDGKFFGADRSYLLSNLFHRNPHLALLAEDTSKSLLGFTMGRMGRNAIQIGPTVSPNSIISNHLIQRSIGQCTGSIFIDVPNHHEETHKWLTKLGFSCQRQFMRMGKGITGPADKPDAIFAIAGPELG
jgi:GNAT superfamily N-acetyltransferase